jgi:hypothetical protein
MENDSDGSGWTRLCKSVKLMAPGSACRAWYSLTLYQLPHGTGFVIQKRSSPKGSTGMSEMWYRHTFEEAEKRFNSIFRQKVGKSGPRQYVEVPEFEPPDQCDLWP